MAFKVLGERDTKWQPRKGLEGPFWFVDRVLYYDPKEGSYWDPTTDFYVEQSEMDNLNQRMMAILAR
jgi:hypothetical protein